MLNQTLIAGPYSVNLAVSSFLYAYGQPTLHPSDACLLPSLLFRELTTRHPERVMIPTREDPAAVLVLRPPEREQDRAARPHLEQP